MFNKCFEDVDSRDLVLVKDIEVFSYCEHHIALMYNMKCHVGYIPNGKVIGLSKIARICDMVCKRLQLQERICSDIAEIMQKVCETEDVIVIVDGVKVSVIRKVCKIKGQSFVLNNNGRFAVYAQYSAFVSAVPVHLSRVCRGENEKAGKHKYEK